MPNSHRPTILLRSAWQDCNIGDVAHTPGALRLLLRRVPEARVILWPWTPLTPTLTDRLMTQFPELRIVNGAIDAAGRPTTPELAKAIEQSDLFLHGSGPATIAWADAAAFKRITGRPFGVYGVTYGLYGIPERAALSDAAFVYFRDSRSLARAQSEGVKAPVMGLSPDTAFAFDDFDDAGAEAYLREVGLQDARFLCCIPRMRCTPFWEIARKGTPFDPVRHARNEETKEHDHARLREAIIEVVRRTGMRVLVCPEDETQIAIGRQLLIERLPADVRPRVVQRDAFWTPEMALSVYVRSAGLFGNEMHSPILCVSHGVPAVVCHSADVSTKGYMWEDVGLREWLFDLDSPADYDRIVPAVLSIASDPDAARAKARAARDRALTRLADTAGVVRSTVLSSHASRRDASPASRRLEVVTA